MLRDQKNLRVMCDDGASKWVYETKAFHICGSSSALAKALIDAQDPADKRFVIMEDAFLLHELAAMCHFKKTGQCEGEKHAAVMEEIDANMKKLIDPTRLFYHQMHIDTTRACSGGAPSTLMSVEALGCNKPSVARGISNTVRFL